MCLATRLGMIDSDWTRPIRRVRRGTRARGVTLVEVLIVIAIMALLAGGVGVAVLKYWSDAQDKTTATNARTIRGAVKAWWIDHDRGECPGVEELVAAGTLD